MALDRFASSSSAFALAMGLSLIAPGSLHAATSDCPALRSLQIDNAVIVSAERHDAGPFKPPAGASFQVGNAFCRVVISARPSPASDITIEVWLPDAARWNGRFWGLGNGGFAGSIFHRGLGARVAAGYAAVATDTGHRGDSADVSWAIGQPEKVIDYGHRAIHLAAVQGKRVAGAYYGRAPDFSYFSAYSNGGRQALMLAQRYPEDYDGIIAGAPAYDFTRTYAAVADTQFNVLAGVDRHLSPDQLAALSESAIDACDATDGVKDGVIEEPDLCRFDPAVVACPDKAGERCLTPSQLSTVRRLYSGLKVGATARAIGALPPASEVAWGDIHFGKGPGSGEYYTYGLGFMRGFVYEDSAWDPGSFDLIRSATLAERKVAPVLDAISTDLRRFVARGGKLILWHGWNDPAVSAYDTVDYYVRVVDALGSEAARRAVRLFMVPGVEHGRGGPGTDQFGQFAGGTGDPERSVAAAMQRWVERGISPERLIASRAPDPKNAAAPARTRPLCAWPLSARYRGTGSTDDAANFDCVNVRR